MPDKKSQKVSLLTDRTRVKLMPTWMKMKRMRAYEKLVDFVDARGGSATTLELADLYKGLELGGTLREFCAENLPIQF